MIYFGNHMNSEASTDKKAGFLPYVLMADGPLFMFMVSSNAYYGGDRPMISKGQVEVDEDDETAAIREAEEELGLIRANLRSSFRAWSEVCSGMCSSYLMTIYAGEVIDQSRFNTPHFETKETVWLTLQQFKERGRASHVPIVEQIHDQIVKEKGA